MQAMHLEGREQEAVIISATSDRHSGRPLRPLTGGLTSRPISRALAATLPAISPLVPKAVTVEFQVPRLKNLELADLIRLKRAIDNALVNPES